MMVFLELVFFSFCTNLIKHLRYFCILDYTLIVHEENLLMSVDLGFLYFNYFCAHQKYTIHLQCFY